jgi:hypothetical protein
MSEKLLRFLLLSEIKTVRLKCKRPDCDGVVEIPIARLEKRFPCDSCSVCKAPFEVTGQGLLGSMQFVNWLSVLAQAVAALNKDSVQVDVEFVLPAEQVCRLGQTGD